MPFKPARVLLVDNHTDTLSFIAAVVEGLGHRISMASSFREAEHRCLAQRFDLLISKLRMPDGSGIDIVKGVAAKCRLPAIAIGGTACPGDVQAGLDAGFDAYLTTPIEIEALKTAIARVLAAASQEGERHVGDDLNMSATRAAGDWTPLPALMVLIVDDNARLWRLLVHSLPDAGFEASCDGSGYEAVRTIETTIPTVVALDDRMPTITVLEAINTLRQNGKYADLPVLFYSAGTEPSPRENALKLGAADRLEKRKTSWSDVVARIEALARASRSVKSI